MTRQSAGPNRSSERTRDDGTGSVGKRWATHCVQPGDRTSRGRGLRPPSPSEARCGSAVHGVVDDAEKGASEEAGCFLSDWVATAGAACRAWCSRLRRSLRVSRLVSAFPEGTGAGFTFGSGRGSVLGSRFSAGWPSIPDLEQTMQQKIEPGRIGPRCGHVDCGVNGVSGKSGTSSGSRSSETAHPGYAIGRSLVACFLARDRSSRIRDASSRRRALATPSCTRRQPSPTRRAISLIGWPRRTSSSQSDSAASASAAAPLVRPWPCSNPLPLNPLPPISTDAPLYPRACSILVDPQPPGRDRPL
jgi:hypothetical protein